MLLMQLWFEIITGYGSTSKKTDQSKTCNVMNSCKSAFSWYCLAKKWLICSNQANIISWRNSWLARSNSLLEKKNNSCFMCSSVKLSRWNNRCGFYPLAPFYDHCCSSVFSSFYLIFTQWKQSNCLRGYYQAPLKTICIKAVLTCLQFTACTLSNLVNQYSYFHGGRIKLHNRGKQTLWKVSVTVKTDLSNTLGIHQNTLNWWR